MLNGRNRRENCSLSSTNDKGKVGCQSDTFSSVATVRVLGYQSDSTICVSWFDPTACHYGDQLWKLSIARLSGVCALSHRAIQAGDLIFRPIRVRLQPKPVNVNFMILAAAVEDVQISDT
ncbi:DUF3331 domain-containing protein [Burkholderia sp. LMG 21824]|uniref:DUF3331 domain-containing protein n=1 Tax=Burkholderia sp. LMG 21824 TaxID=3158172 RepID=UPI003C2E204C